LAFACRLRAQQPNMSPLSAMLDQTGLVSL